jgi:hypothetical protein
MTILKDVFAELLSMFITDLRLTITTLLLVAFVAVLTMGLGVSTPLAGAILLCGSVAIVIEATIRETRHRMK